MQKNATNPLLSTRKSSMICRRRRSRDDNAVCSTNAISPPCRPTTIPPCMQSLWFNTWPTLDDQSLTLHDVDRRSSVARRSFVFRRSSFLCLSSFVVPLSFVVRRSSFVVPLSFLRRSFVVPLSFAVPSSSFVVRSLSELLSSEGLSSSSSSLSLECQSNET